MCPAAPVPPDGDGAVEAVLVGAHADLAGVLADAATLPLRQQRLVSWLARDLLDALGALRRVADEGRRAAPALELGTDRVAACLADLIEITGGGARAAPAPVGDFDLAFRRAAGRPRSALHLARRP